ncbi:MAG: hypothetical protein NVSMB32_04570 [Actinomycetota bacterium]
MVSTSTAPAEVEGLMDLAGVSGSAPIFDAALLYAAGVLARSYVHPLASFLHLLTPPQMGRAMGRRAAPAPSGSQQPAGAVQQPGPWLPGAAVAGRALHRLAPRQDPLALYGPEISRVLAAGLGAIVVVPEVREGTLVLERLRAAFPHDVAVVHSGLAPAERAKALWAVARGKRRVVLGGRAAVLAPAFPLGVVIVHDEADRTLKEQRSPYYDAREVAQVRAAACGADLVMASEGPTLRSLHRAQGGGWAVTEPPRGALRANWALVELVEPLVAAIVSGGGFMVDNPMGLRPLAPVG